MTSPTRFSALPGDRNIIETQLRLLLKRSATDAGPVVEAMNYAVFGGGQRIRPLLALRTAHLLNQEPCLALRAGASVELLHCASLIIDDLPCMDNEQLRRNRPTVHVRFGEATAILAAFGLVALAARSLIEKYRLVEFQGRLLGSLDVSALLGGQSLDLSLSGRDREIGRARMSELKTVPLFELSIRAGLLSANANPEEEELLLEFGRRFGAAYQLADDLLDGEECSAEPVLEELAAARACLGPFGSQRHELEELVDYLHDKTFEDSRCHR